MTEVGHDVKSWCRRVSGEFAPSQRRRLLLRARDEPEAFSAKYFDLLRL
jgi:hypothetical protein